MPCELPQIAARARRASAWTAVVLFFAAQIATAADSRSVRFQHLSRNDGLSQSFVYAIAQDPQGYMWFGTQEGLNRFDGYHFEVFAHDPADPQSISDESVRTLLLDSSGAMWVGTDAGGLSRYDADSGEFKNYLHDPNDPTSIADNRVRTIFEDSKGTLWIGTDGSGLDRFDRENGVFEHFRHDPSAPSSLAGNDVWSIEEGGDGVLWVATGNGLSRLDVGNGTIRNYRHDLDVHDSLGDNRLRVLHVDRHGTLWVGTESEGLCLFDADNESFEHYRHDPEDDSSISADRIHALYEDDAGVLWVGTIEGLNAWNPVSRGFDRYTHDPADRYSLANNNVASLFQDRGGVFWVGTYDGLSRWNQATRAMKHYRHDPTDMQSLSGDFVMSFAEDQTGRVWVATYGSGVSVLDRPSGEFRHLRHDPANAASLSSDRVTAVYVDTEGTLWVGTRTAGLNRYDAESGRFARYRHDPQDPSSISADGVTWILEDRNGGLWVGTFGGGLNFVERETDRFRRYVHDPDDTESLSNDRVLVLFEDRSAQIWVGTYGGGLNRFDPVTGQFEHVRAALDDPKGLGGDEVYMIQESPAGDLWIGIKGRGLYRWRRDDRDNGNVEFEHYSELDGLSSSTIYSGVFDEAGYLWMSTARGLSRLDTRSMEFRNFDVGHGLQGEEYNLAAGFRAANGEIFFGGVNGFNAFQPSLLDGNSQPPQVAITKLIHVGHPVTLGDGSIEVSHDQNVIGFEFAALDYAAPESNRLEYRLEGIDPDWIEAGKDHSVTYSNLPAGEFTFRVKAANYDGTWSDKDATLVLSVLPAPWNSWWAYLIYAFTSALLIAAVFRAHTRRTKHAAALRHADELAVVQSRLTEAQQIARIGNWDWNASTNELWWSDEVYRLFQLAPDEFDATFEAFLERVHPEDRDTVKRSVDRALADKEPYAIDHRIIRSDGTERIVHERAVVEFGIEGDAVRMAGTVHDITDRKQAEDEIRHRADFQAMLAWLSSELIRAQPDDIDQQIADGLDIVGSRFGLDTISIYWFTDDREAMQASHRWARIEKYRQKPQLNRIDIPWIAAELLAGNAVTIDNVESMPEDAARDQKLLKRRGVQSLLLIPLLIDENLEGACVFTMRRHKRAWSLETIAELKLVAESLAGAIARSHAMAEIKDLQDQLQEENLYLREEVRLAHGFDDIVGENDGLQQCLQAVEKVAPTDVSVLVLGETGTGKELIARALHKLSARRDGPIVSVNCPALPGNLIESELFGHEKGAFTGAESQRRGRFELARGGTLFLDEIGELPQELQVKLLRVLQTGEFERLGGTKTLNADVRLIAATNRDLPRSIELGEFRADLYYRISSFPIQLPPLRERTDDIPLLAEHFVHKHADRLNKKVEAISARMINQLMDYDWPGNIRELESTIERALISSPGGAVLELPDPLQWMAKSAQKELDLPADGGDLLSVERAYIVNVLEQTKWKISGDGGAAELLGVPSSTLRSKMKRLGISRSED